jgi:hypothetical protein
MKFFVVLLFLSNLAIAQNTPLIQPGKDYKAYTHAELQRRVFELENIVLQMQQKALSQEAAAKESEVKVDPNGQWFCKIRTVGSTFTGVGPTKELATSKVMSLCQAAHSGDSIRCRTIECNQ